MPVRYSTQACVFHKINHLNPFRSERCELFFRTWISGQYCIVLEVEDRRERLARRLIFRRIVLDEAPYLHYLLRSQERSQDIVNRLRSSQTYEHYSVRTEKLSITFYQAFYLIITNSILSDI